MAQVYVGQGEAVNSICNGHTPVVKILHFSTNLKKKFYTFYVELKQEEIASPGTGVTNKMVVSHHEGCWEQNADPLEEQQCS